LEEVEAMAVDAIEEDGSEYHERLDGNVDSQTRLTTASCYIVQATTIPA